jgi:hypothetical protein
MDTHTNSAGPSSAEWVDAPAQTASPAALTFVAPPAVETAAAPAVDFAFNAFGQPQADEPPARASEPETAAAAAIAPEVTVAPARGLVPSQAAAEPAPAVSVAGLRSPGPDIQNALWRKMRANDAERRAGAAPRQAAPVVPPPEQRARVSAAPAASASRNGRLALLAASIALVAGVGAAAGAAGFAGFVKMTGHGKQTASIAATPATLHRADLADETRVIKDGLAQVRGSIRALSDGVSSVRANVDNSGKTAVAQIAKVNDQVAKLSDAVARLERSQAEPAAKLAKVIDTLEKLEHRAASIANTDSAARHTASIAPIPAPAAPETTGSVASNAIVRGAPPQPLRPPAISGWTVRSVFEGVALLDGPDRSIEVERGDNIRGVGRVEDITRQGNRWIVVTNRGFIVSR